MHCYRHEPNQSSRWLTDLLFNILLTRVVDIHGLGGKPAAGVAQLGQRRWDEVPVRNGSQVQILPSAPQTYIHSELLLPNKFTF